MLKQKRLQSQNHRELSILIEDRTLNEKTVKLQEFCDNENVCLYYFNNNSNDMDLLAFPVSSLWSIWNNYIVVDDWKYAEFIVNITTNCKKIFYMYDINWHKQSLSYDEQLVVLNDVDLVICRCQDHAQLIEKRYGITPKVMLEYDLKTLNTILKDV